MCFPSSNSEYTNYPFFLVSRNFPSTCHMPGTDSQEYSASSGVSLCQDNQQCLQIWCDNAWREQDLTPPHKVSEIRQAFEWEPKLMNNSFSHALVHILVIQNQVTSGRQRRKDYSLPGYRLGCWGYSREVSIKHFASGLRTVPRKSLCPLDGPFVIYWILRFMQTSLWVEKSWLYCTVSIYSWTFSFLASRLDFMFISKGPAMTPFLCWKRMCSRAHYVGAFSLQSEAKQKAWLHGS